MRTGNWKTDGEWARFMRDGWQAPANDNFRACNCIGPQDGKPLCPCRMRGLQIVDGRYVEVVDHGPATVRSKA